MRLVQLNLIRLGGLALIALTLRLFRLDAQSLWLDEGSTWAEVTGRSGKGWLTLTSELFSPDAGYPLYHLLLRGWILVAGDSEWALRFPSALAGALACVVIAMAAAELQPQPGIGPAALVAGMLAAIAPYAIWHAQDAKAYSLLLLAMASLCWLTLRAMRIGSMRSWLAAAAVGLVCLFVHRLALLGIAGIALGLALTAPAATGRIGWLLTMRWPAILVALASGAIGILGILAAARAEGAAGSHTAIGPLTGVALTLARFALDRWPGDIDGFLGLPALIWFLPFAVMAATSVVLLLRDAHDGNQAALLVLCAFFPPLLLLAAVLLFAPIYEPRYAMVAFAPWIIVLSRPLHRFGSRIRYATGSLLLLILLACTTTLVQPGKGLFSGDPVKEQWREAVAALAQRVVPDDLVIVHPYYVMPLYDYYAPRVTPDPLPQPISFPIFAEGDRGGLEDDAALRDFIRKRYDPFYREQAQDRRRVLLLIAPDHAATIDPPPTAADRYGWLGLRFAYPQRTWPCGGATFVGVEIMCQSYPEVFGSGVIPQPATPLIANFGSELQLRGISITPHGTTLRAGGTLPITLYWQATAPPGHDYRMFLHLCRECDTPPLANNDSPPLFGYGDAGRTTTWRIADPVHDERALLLPADLAPGTYSLLLGVYTVEDGELRRLPITSTTPSMPDNRLVIAQVEIGSISR